MCGWLSFQTEEAVLAALRIPFFRYAWSTNPISDYTSLCCGFNEIYRAFLGIGNRRIRLYQTVTYISDVEEGNNLMLTRLASAATLEVNRQKVTYMKMCIVQ